MSMYQKPVFSDKRLDRFSILGVVRTARNMRAIQVQVAHTMRCAGRTTLLVLLLFFAGLPLQAGAADLRSGPLQDVAWNALMERLVADGFRRDRMRHLFSRVETGYSPGPMGHKMRALFRRKFTPPRPAKPAPPNKKTQPSVYPGVLVEINLRRARLFLNEHKSSLARMERRFGVPKEVAVGLMLVETRLGSFLGREQAFSNLACLAASDSLERIRPEIKDLKMTGTRRRWLRERLEAKSSWAYDELKALIIYSERNGLDPITMPGSIYGAVGICQFMPSNILRFGVDGNDDGKVNLFHVQDAIHSLANYLKYHGWKPGLSRAKQCRVLRHYNNSSTYANTILAVADALR